MNVININHIQLGAPVQSGHEVYPNAIYCPPSGHPGHFFSLGSVDNWSSDVPRLVRGIQLDLNKGKKPLFCAKFMDTANKSRHVGRLKTNCQQTLGKADKKIVFKKNKHNKAQFSRLEASFTQLAQLFLDRHVTSQQELVVDNSGQVVGLASEHLCYIVEKKEGLNRVFYTLDIPAINCSFTPYKASVAEEIPYYFLDKLPHGFFARLVAKEQEGHLSINYSSLANILTSSYTLEEDDLHKGNFGFYLVEKQGKPEAVFFKIDHDLMFVNSIMSFYSIRPYHFFQGESAFDITAEDLLDFPNVTDSANTYWPTKKSILPNPWSTKDYQSKQEVESFSSLGALPAFQKAKWRSFYKHILIPEALIEHSLTECLDKENAFDRAQIALMVQATLARQARLRAMLFSLKEFREFLGCLPPEDKKSLFTEILHFSPNVSKVLIKKQVADSISSYEKLCMDGGFEEGDTPLHTAIKLGDFRYEETMHMFGHLVNEKNHAGKSPLDIALEKVHHSEKHPKDIRQDLRFTMNYLLKYGAKKSTAFDEFNVKEQIESYKFQTPYLDRVRQVKSYQDFKEILRDIGEDHSYCLKFKKNLAISCIKQFMHDKKELPNFYAMLLKLKNEVNGHCANEDGAGVKYLRQLRSRLWIVRQIRGLYGWSSTQGEINTLINEELEHMPEKDVSCFSFFVRPREGRLISDDLGMQSDLLTHF